MCFWRKTGERRSEFDLAFIPVFKHHAHILCVLKHCTNIVYISNHLMTNLFWSPKTSIKGFRCYD